MSTQTQSEITRLQNARNKLRTKGVELGITTGTAKLDEIATAYEGIDNKGAVSATVQEGDTYTIPKGYHNGSGTVSGVAGGGNYSLQSKSATPSKKQQNVTPDQGYYGLSDVTVNPIPDNFQDVTPVTAGAGDVLANKVIVNAKGETVAGTMPNNGAVAPAALAAGGSYTIPAGYHNGSGTVTAQNLASQTQGTATADDMLKSKTAWVNGGQVTGTIPVWNDIDVDGMQLPAGQGFTYDAGYHKYDTTIYAQDLESQTPGDAAAGDLIAGKTAWVNGAEVEGSMPSIGAQTATINAGGSVTISKGYHDGTGKITGASLSSQTPGDAAAANILSGKKAWVAGTQITGTMKDNGAVAPSALAAGGSYTIPAGYHNGSGKVTAVSLASQTAGTAAASEILSGETAWVGGSKVTGTMTNNGAKTLTIDGLTATSVTIPAGYHNGSGKVSLTSDIEEALAAI